MAALDRFGGPESWDLYCQEQEERYEALIDGASCLDCDQCTRRSEEVGYCRLYGEVVTSEDTPKNIGCEVFSTWW